MSDYQLNTRSQNIDLRAIGGTGEQHASVVRAPYAQGQWIVANVGCHQATVVAARPNNQNLAIESSLQRGCDLSVVLLEHHAHVDDPRTILDCPVDGSRDGRGIGHSLFVHDAIESELSVRRDASQQRQRRRAMAVGVIRDTVSVLVEAVGKVQHVRIPVDEVSLRKERDLLVAEVETRVQDGNPGARTRGLLVRAGKVQSLKQDLAFEVRPRWRLGGQVDHVVLTANPFKKSHLHCQDQYHQHSQSVSLHDVSRFRFWVPSDSTNLCSRGALSVCRYMNSMSGRRPGGSSKSRKWNGLAAAVRGRGNKVAQDSESEFPPGWERLSSEFWQLLQTDAQAALTIGRRLRKLSRGHADGYLQSSGCHALGCAYLALGEVRAADRWLREAIRIAKKFGYPGAAAHSSINRTHALLLQGRIPSALSEARAVKKFELQRGNLIGAARAAMAEANVYGRTHQPTRALSVLDDARQLLHEAEDNSTTSENHGSQLAALATNRANVLSLLGRTQEAREEYRSVKTWAQQRQQWKTYWDASYNEACLLAMAGQWQDAYDLFETTRPGYEKIGDDRGLVMLDMNNAELHLRLRLFEDAELIATRAIEGARALHLSYPQCRGLLIRGSARSSQGNLQEALEDLETSQTSFRHEANIAWESVAAASLAEVHLALGQGGPALELLRAATRRAQTQPAPMITVQLRQAEARTQLELGNFEDAHRASTSARRALTHSATPWLREDVWALRGKIHMARGNRAAAKRAYIRAIESLELSHSLVLSGPLGSSFLRQGHEVYEDLLAIYLDEGSAAGLEAAFHTVDRSRGRAWAQLRGTQSSTEDAELAPTWARLHALYDQLSGSAQSPPRLLAQRRREIQSEIDTQEQRLLQLLRRQSEHSQRFPRSPKKSVALARTALEPNEALIEYFVVADQVHAFVLRRRGLQVYQDLGSVRSIQKLVRKLHLHLDHQNADGESFDPTTAAARSVSKNLHKLYQRLLEPLEPSLRGELLTIIPHGPLHAVPFVALEDADGVAAIDRWQLANLPTRELLFQQQHSDAPTASVAFGVTQERNPKIARELRSVDRLLPNCEVRVGPQATIEELKNLAPTARVLHLACHAQHRADNPIYSALQLSDGWLPAWQLSQIRLNCTLAVLSACETGKIQASVPGEEWMGLARSFLSAGARNLVVCPWRVRDEVAYERSRAFYRHLQAGHSIRAAHQRAAQDLRDKFPNPGDWAAFVLLGRGQDFQIVEEDQ